MSDITGSWIWTSAPLPERNAFVRFRRAFRYQGGRAFLRLTADSRYVLYLDGEYLGQGPARAWPAHYRYDTYDLQPLLSPGDHVLAVRVNHFGESTFQYLHQPPGLLAKLELRERVDLVTDEAWRATPDPAFTAAAPRISVQEGFEEQYDARLDDGWRQLGYDDSAWPAAVVLRGLADGPHQDLAPAGIPPLTLEPVLPQRLVRRDGPPPTCAEVVESLPHRFTVYTKPYLAPDDRSSNHLFAHAYLVTRIHAPEATDVRLLSPHRGTALKLNGAAPQDGRASLRAGWNDLVLSLHRDFHDPELCLVVDGPAQLRFCAGAGAGGPTWAVVGPFALTETDRAAVARHMDASIVLAEAIDADATAEAGEAFWVAGEVAAAAGGPYWRPVADAHAPAVDVFLQSYTDRVVTNDVAIVTGEEALVAGNGQTTVASAHGHDVRLLLDFGRELLGYHRLELSAPAGTIVDVHNFEMIQPDGRYNFAEGMNNSFRYVCREGRQVYQTHVRRGFRYSYLTFRHLTGPVHLHRVQALFASYPQQRLGTFASADAQLDRIWEVGAHSLRCCAEDTYTDCPTYEQTHWVGDARNEALVDWVVNGDPRLWYRCLEQTGQSLDRSPITESQVPSGWENLLPAWSFLWMRSCREFYLYTGQREAALRLLGYVTRNIAGIAGLLNADGLFELRAWNMFDWAAMDTPPDAVVTHLNCFLVQALHDAADLADWLDQGELGPRWRGLAQEIADAVNRHLWVEAKGAYTDCLRGTEPSAVFSQQTQTAACMAGVAENQRGARCRELMHHPPENYVKAGSPFFEFFLLEAYQQEGRDQELIDAIRRDWGFMVDMGATTFWEMWSLRGGRLTRSHCHGWSAAPTFFLSTWVLGVRPLAPGFQSLVVAPHPGDLRWCRGTMPLPGGGTLGVQWENEPDQPFVLRVTAPADQDVRIVLPREGTATVNGEPA